MIIILYKYYIYNHPPWVPPAGLLIWHMPTCRMPSSKTLSRHSVLTSRPAWDGLHGFNCLMKSQSDMMMIMMIIMMMMMMMNQFNIYIYTVGGPKSSHDARTILLYPFSFVLRHHYILKCMYISIHAIVTMHAPITPHPRSGSQQQPVVVTAKTLRMQIPQLWDLPMKNRQNRLLLANDCSQIPKILAIWRRNLKGPLKM